MNSNKIIYLSTCSQDTRLLPLFISLILNMQTITDTKSIIIVVINSKNANGDNKKYAVYF